MLRALPFTINKKILGTALIPSSALAGGLGFRPGSKEPYGIMVNYNGQADLLLSLQIPPDYYPYQFKKTALYDYLTDVRKYMVSNEYVSENKKKLYDSLQTRLNHHLGKIKEFGPSLWNEDLYDTGIVFRNDQFWSSKGTKLLFLEQFIADDHKDIEDAYGLLPSHKKLIVTNYRAARDPYTIFSKEVFQCFEKDNSCSGSENKDKLYKGLKEYVDKYDQEEINSLYRFGRFIKFWNGLAKGEHKAKIEKLLVDKNLFSLVDEEDKLIADKYAKTVFSEEEIKKLKEWVADWKMNYLTSTPGPKLAHHPALEQQIIPGTAPLSEGSQKDIIVFLYQFAASIDDYVKNDDNFQKDFKDDYRKTFMEKALANATLMAENITERIKAIREYFKHIKVVDEKFDPEKKIYTNTDSKAFTVLTYPPASFGAGEATIQSVSKFPWLYRDIGLKQPIPSNLKDTIEDHDLSREIFSVDDNGWWWNIGSAVLNSDNLLKFKGTADTLLILANEDDWNLLQDGTSGILGSSASMLKGSPTMDLSKIQGNEPSLRNNKQYPVSYNRYHLWNEGLRSPIALNLMFDNLVDIFTRQYVTLETMNENKDDWKSKYSKAMDWGKYWDTHFLEGTSADTTKATVV